MGRRGLAVFRVKYVRPTWTLLKFVVLGEVEPEVLSFVPLYLIDINSLASSVLRDLL